MRTRFEHDGGTVERARKLRRQSTPARGALWAAIRGSRLDRWKFRRQQRLGSGRYYYADFMCHAARLIIEADGETHAHSAMQDARRPVFLNGEGIRVLRSWNNEALSNPEGVRAVIRAALNEAPHPHPSAALHAAPSLSPEGRRIA